jgi:hypothetical protein
MGFTWCGGQCPTETTPDHELACNRQPRTQKTIKRHETKIQGLLHPAQANLGYFLAWFQSLQLPSTQSESPLASKYHLYSTLNGISHISIRINRNRNSEGLLYFLPLPSPSAVQFVLTAAVSQDKTPVLTTPAVAGNGCVSCLYFRAGAIGSRKRGAVSLEMAGEAAGGGGIFRHHRSTLSTD